MSEAAAPRLPGLLNCMDGALYVVGRGGAGAGRGTLVAAFHQWSRHVKSLQVGRWRCLVSVFLVLFLISGLVLVRAFLGWARWASLECSSRRKVVNAVCHVSDAPAQHVEPPPPARCLWRLNNRRVPASGQSDAGAAGVCGGGSRIDSMMRCAREDRFLTRSANQMNCRTGDTGVWTLSPRFDESDSSDPMSIATVHSRPTSRAIPRRCALCDYSACRQGDGWGIALSHGHLGLPERTGQYAGLALSVRSSALVRW